MKIVKKALYTTLLLACAAIITPVNAEEKVEETTKPRAVLFKLHDIKPAVNSEGAVTHCDFLVTFYNRTTESFRNAQIAMGWTDEVSERYFADEVQPVGEPTRATRTRRENQEEKLGSIVTKVDMPSLGSYKQASVKASVKTDKCFLLLDNLEYNVEACNMIGKEEKEKSSRRRAKTAVSSECANLFEYVDSKNPEYYDEFKNVSFSEQERMTGESIKHDVSNLEESYKAAVKNFEKVQDTLGHIK